MNGQKVDEKRSRNMSAIKRRDTKPELLLRTWLYSRGYRYRLSVNYVPGHPDLFLRKYNTAIFMNGCFWHRHAGCKYAYTPKSNLEFWRKKFEANICRDHEVRDILRAKGIRCLVIWECTIRKMKHNIEYKNEILQTIDQYLQSDDLFFEI